MSRTAVPDPNRARDPRDPTSSAPGGEHQPVSSASVPAPTTDATNTDTPTAQGEADRADTRRALPKALAVLAAAAVVFGLAHVFTGLFMALAALAAVGAVVGIGVIAIVASLPWLLAALVVIALLAGIASMPWWLFVALVVITLVALMARNLHQHRSNA